MRVEQKSPARGFRVGVSNDIIIQDCGSVWLEPNEQVTFRTNRGAEYDVTRKEWGFYATPSLNGRLADFGLRSVLIQNRASKRYYLLLVERGHEPEFRSYLEDENLRLVHWLDTDEACQSLDALLGG